MVNNSGSPHAKKFPIGIPNKYILERYRMFSIFILNYTQNFGKRGFDNKCTKFSHISLITLFCDGSLSFCPFLNKADYLYVVHQYTYNTDGNKISNRRGKRHPSWSRGGSRGGVVLGVKIPPPFFGGPPKLNKLPFSRPVSAPVSRANLDSLHYTSKDFLHLPCQSTYSVRAMH